MTDVTASTITKRRCDCGKPTGADAYVCKDCGKDAREHLRTIAELTVYADDKRARWSAIDYTKKGVSRPAETPLPHDPRVSRVIDPIANGLAGLHNVICEGRGWHLALRDATIQQTCAWIETHVDWLRTTPEGVEELAFLERAANDLARLFDRPPERFYLGRCEAVIGTDEDGTETTCEAHVYVEQSKTLPPVTECPRCKNVVDVNGRRDEFQEAVKVYQATMRELVTLAPLFLTEGVSRRTLHEWTRHRLLLPVGERMERDKEGKTRYTPTYRIGDLAEARIAWDAIVEERKEQRARKSA